jgi:hypothetical protein
MMMGALELVKEVAPLPGPLLVHAARAPTHSTATALVVSTAFLENQGRTGLTPGSSFLLVEDSPGPSPPERPRALIEGYTGPAAIRAPECGEINTFAARTLGFFDDHVKFAAKYDVFST